MSNLDTNTSPKPIIEQFKLEPVRRNLTVIDVRSLTPRMVRVTLGGDELAGFRSPSPDDHIKVFLPEIDGGAEGREYTPRHFDPEKKLLTVDFFLHDGGLTSSWLQQAKPGDRVLIAGPRGSKVISAPGAWWLLIGDETALPAVGRRLEEIAAGTRVITLMAVTGPEEEQQFETKANLTANWVHRPDTEAATPGPILKGITELKLPQGPGFIWIAAEAEVARAVREYLINTLGHPAEWTKASAYWTQKPAVNG